LRRRTFLASLPALALAPEPEPIALGPSSLFCSTPGAAVLFEAVAERARRLERALRLYQAELAFLHLGHFR
jgi:hypothetical protein